MQEKEKSAGKTAKAKEPKKSWFQGLKAEFNKIVWTDRDTLETVSCCYCHNRNSRCDHQCDGCRHSGMH